MVLFPLLSNLAYITQMSHTSCGRCRYAPAHNIHTDYRQDETAAAGDSPSSTLHHRRTIHNSV